MLDILLTDSDGGTAWRSELADGEARAGWECVGPLGLAKRLGRLLGIRGEPFPHADRVAVYGARLAQLAGVRSFSRSWEKDPWGVAEFMLSLRDRLRAAGWDGAELQGSQRLVDLAAVERLEGTGIGTVPPGLADVFTMLLADLAQCSSLPEPLRIHIASPLPSFDSVVHRVLEVLAEKGATITHPDSPQPSAPDGTDLGRLQRTLLTSVAREPGAALSGDGTVLLLEADTPLEAGELAAGVARSLALGEATLVQGRDLSALEIAFLRQGLPRLGVRERSRLRPALQVLPLRLALAFSPRDPFRAAELLMLPVAPLSRAIRRRLLEALVKQPGIGGPVWQAAVAEVADERERARIESWFGGPTFDRQEGLPAAEAVRICDLVARWAEACARSPEERGEPEPLLLGAAQVARTLARMISEQGPRASLSPVALEQLHEIAAGTGFDGEGAAGEASRPAIALQPGAVRAGARTVLWWGFLGGEPGPRPEPWTAAEREALEARGVRVPKPGEWRELEAAGWRRAILAPSERLVLVRWRLEGTEPTVVHPVADEVAARFEQALAPCTVPSEAALAGAFRAVDVPHSDRAPAPEIAPRALFRVPPEIISADRLSPSSLEKLLSCPVAWVLEYAAGLRRRGMARIPSGDRLLGSFAHSILEDMLLGPRKVDLEVAAPEEAARWALEEFDARVEKEAAPLVASGAIVERHRAREVVGDAARSLFALLQRGRWRPRAAEAELTGVFDGLDVAGRADLLVEKGGRPAIIDLKLAKPRYFRERLESGQALQVALYADMVRNGGPLPPTGYFLLNRGELFTVDSGEFPDAREFSGPSMEDTLADALDAIRFWRAVLAKGLVVSRRKEICDQALLEAGEVAGRPVPTRGPGGIDPPCRFRGCEYSVLCGVALREIAR